MSSTCTANLAPPAKCRWHVFRHELLQHGATHQPRAIHQHNSIVCMGIFDSPSTCAPPLVFAASPPRALATRRPHSPPCLLAASRPRLLTALQTPSLADCGPASQRLCLAASRPPSQPRSLASSQPCGLPATPLCGLATLWPRGVSLSRTCLRSHHGSAAPFLLSIADTHHRLSCSSCADGRQGCVR